MSFPVVIHHNPDCGTFRTVLRIIRAAGYAPVVIDYLAEGWTRPQLLALFAAPGTPADHPLDPTPPGPFAKADGQLIIDAKGNRLV